MMTSSTMDFWHWGLSDAHIEMLREFRETTGRPHSVHSSTFLEFIDPETIPEEHHVIEFLWAYAPLYYRSYPEPPDELREEVAALIRFMPPRRKWRPEACLAICADAEAFQHRWSGLYRTPLPLWLEELRSMLELRGLRQPSPLLIPTIPLDAPSSRRSNPGSMLSRYSDSGRKPNPPHPCKDRPRNHRHLLTSRVSSTSLAPAPSSPRRDTSVSPTEGCSPRRSGCGDLFDEKIGDRVFKTRSSSEIEPLDLVVRWARAAGLVRTEHGKLILTRKGRRLGENPLDDWWLLFRTAVLKLNWLKRRYRADRKPFWAELVSECVPAYLRIAVDAGSRGVAILPLAQITWGLVQERWVTEDLSDDQIRWQQSSISSAIRRGFFLPLELLGCAQTWIGAAHGAVRMSPLGIWGVNRLSGELNAPLTPDYGSSVSSVVDLSEWRARDEPTP